MRDLRLICRCNGDDLSSGRRLIIHNDGLIIHILCCDKVMWSKLYKLCGDNGGGDSKGDDHKHGCRHVFHQECIMPWLLEKRENECPSCRAAFIVDAPEQEKKQPERPQARRRTPSRELTPEEQADIILAQYARNGTIEVPSGSDDATTRPPSIATTGNSSNEPVDIEAMLSSIDDSDDEMEVEEGFSFVIDQGQIRAVPTSYGSLAVPIPFGRQVSQPKTIAPIRTADTAEESQDEEDDVASHDDESER